MIRFKTFLESKLPKNLTLTKVRGDMYSASMGYDGHPRLVVTEVKFWTKYINALNEYINEYVKGKFILEQREKIPSKYRKAPEIVYRGLVVNGKLFKKLLKDGFKRKPVESWSSKEKIGTQFAIANDNRNFDDYFAIRIDLKIPKKNVLLNVVDFVKSREIIEIAATTREENFDSMAQSLAETEHEIIVAGSEMGPIKLSDKNMIFWWYDGDVWFKMPLKEIAKSSEIQ